MTDTNSHHSGAIPTEGDGIHYRGIVWFMIILVATTVVCELIVVGMYKFMDSSARANGVQRAELAAPAGTLPPPPNLLLDEPSNLHKFREREQTELEHYGWVDKNAGTVRLPIDRAKELVLEKGFPVAAHSMAAKEADVKGEVKKEAAKETHAPAAHKPEVKK